MITINLEKAKVLGHQIRRELRAEEFAPHDDAIAKQIPGAMELAEPARQAIREKYVVVQNKIDVATSVEEIKNALGLEGNA